MQQVSKTGVCLDNRPEDQKLSDYKHEEIAMGFKPYEWVERPMKPYTGYAYNQSSSLSCVAGGGAIILEKFDGEVISRKDIYNGRINYPGGGMMLHDVLEKIRRGVCSEKLVPSQGLGENQMNARYPITEDIIKSRAKNKVGATFTIDNRDIDVIASIVAHYPIIGFWYFDENGKEWWKPEPEILYNFSSFVAEGVTRHQAIIWDAYLKIGKKTYAVVDTAGVGTGIGKDFNIREVSEEVVKKRLYAAGYGIDDEDEVIVPLPIEKPVYNNNQVLKVGSTGLAVKMLQQVLIYEGLLNIKTPTGVFQGLTRQSVMKLQEKYKQDILVPVQLKAPTGIVGKLTNTFLNKKYK